MIENSAGAAGTSLHTLLPHGPGMILLDAVRSRGSDYVECEAVVGAGKEPVDDEGNVPAWVGLEYMAQTAAVLAGLKARESGKDVERGLLLGSRFIQYETFAFPAGERIVIRADLDFDGERVKVFDCRIADSESGELLQQGKLNVCLYSESPDDPAGTA